VLGSAVVSGLLRKGQGWPRGERASRLTVLKLNDDGQLAIRVENLPEESGESRLDLPLHLRAIAQDLPEGDYLAVRTFENGFTETNNIEVVQPPREIEVQ